MDSFTDIDRQTFINTNTAYRVDHTFRSVARMFF